MTERPNCFGQEWTASATECTGGYDASHLNPTNGSHIRPRCEMFDECGRVMRERAQGVHLPQAPQAAPQAAPHFGGQAAYGQPYGQPQQYGAATIGYAVPASVRQAAAIPAQPTQPRYPPIPSPYYPPVPRYGQPPQYGQPQYGQPQYAQPQPGFQPPPQHFAVQAPMHAPPVELMPRNWFAVPQVLAQHEPREERPGASFLVEVLRGMGMITGLVAADFCSNIPLLRKGE